MLFTSDELANITALTIITMTLKVMEYTNGLLEEGKSG